MYCKANNPSTKSAP